MNPKIMLMTDSTLYRRTSTHCLLIIVSVILILFSGIGCGRKMLPSAPKRPLPVVSNLTYDLLPDRVVLSWSVPEKNEGAMSYIKAYLVYRAISDPKKKDCDDCSLQYQLIAQLPASLASPDGTMRYEDDSKKAVGCTYKIHTRSISGTLGNASNIITIGE